MVRQTVPENGMPDIKIMTEAAGVSARFRLKSAAWFREMEPANRERAARHAPRSMQNFLKIK
jgi:hypothetical protein